MGESKMTTQVEKVRRKLDGVYRLVYRQSVTLIWNTWRNNPIRIPILLLLILLTMTGSAGILYTPNTPVKQATPQTAKAKTYMYSPTSANLVIGSEQTVNTGAAGPAINAGWKSTISTADAYWYVNSTTPATPNLDVQLNIAGVQLQSSNVMIFQPRILVGNSSLSITMQICDWTSSTSVDAAADAQCTGGGWRTVNTRDTTNTPVKWAPTTITETFFRIYDGYFTTGSTGGTAISTPLSNFINSSDNNTIKYRFWSDEDISSSIAIDSLSVIVQTDPAYEAASFTQITGGTPTGTFVNTVVRGNTAGGQIGTTGSDGQRLQVPGTAGAISDFYLSFKNVQTYTGANTIYVRSDYSCSTTGINIKPKIYNFNTSGWEDLTSSAIACSATDANSAWAKNNVTIANYISSNEIRVGWYGSANNTLSIRIDLMFVMIGTTNTDSAACEITFGSGTATNCTNTRDLDSTGTTSTFDNTAADESSTYGNDFYPFDNDADTSTNEEATAANINFSVTPPTDAQITMAEFAGRHAAGTSGSAPTLVTQVGLRDYSALTYNAGNQWRGGWIDLGTSSNSSTQVSTDGMSESVSRYATLYDSGGANVASDYFVDTVNNKMNLRLRSSTAGNSSNNTVTSWDFAMVSIAWVTDSSHATKLYSFSPTGKTLATGSETSRLAQTAASTSGGVNTGGWQSMLEPDGYQWVIAGANVGGGATNYDAQANLSGVRLNGANSLVIKTNVVTNANIGLNIQICDWVSSTSVDVAADANCTTGGWRSIVSQNASNADTTITATQATTGTNLRYEIYDGYFNTGTTGGSAISTPLTNFVDATNGIKIRFYSTTQSSTNLGIDYVQVIAVVNPVYQAGGFTQITGGTPAGTYTNTTLYTNSGSGMSSTSGADSVYLQVPGTAGAISDFYLSFNNVRYYSDANTILVRSDYSCSTTGINITPKIYNFTSAAWENLTTGTIACSTSDANNQWAKNNITMSDYVAGGQIRVGWYGSANNTLNIRIDLMTVMVGSANSDSSACEVSLGTGTATNCTNTRDIDTTGTTSTFDNPAEDETTTRGTGASYSYYGYDNDSNATLDEASSSNVSVPVTQPANTSAVGYNWAARYQGCGYTGNACGATALTVQPGIKYYNARHLGVPNGGWASIGNTTSSSMIFRDQPISNSVGLIMPNARDFAMMYINNSTNTMNLRLRTTIAGTAASNVTTSWDFAMVTLYWIDLGSTISVAGTSSVNGATVAVAVDGVLSVGHTATVGSGTWTISNVWVRNGGTVVVWHDAAADADESTGVTTYDGSGNITGMDLTAHVLSVGSVDDQSTTLPNMALYDNRADEDVMDKFTSSTLAVDATSSYTDEKLYVLGGDTLTVASTETITTFDLTVDGTLSGTGNVTANGSVVGTGTITFTAGTFEQRVGAAKNFGTTSGSTTWTFFDLTFSDSAPVAYTITTQTGGSGGITVSDILKVGKSGDTEATTLNAGNRTWTLSGTGGDPFQLLASPAAVLAGGTSKFYYTGANGGGNTTIQSTSGSYYDLEVNASETFVLEANTVVTNNLTITSGTLDVTASNFSLTIGGSYSNSGTFLANSGTVTFNATTSSKTLAGTMTGATGKFYNLVFDGVGGGWSFAANSAETANNFTITNGTVTAPSTTLTVVGNYSNSSVFTHNSGAVAFSATAIGKTLSGTLSGANGKFYNLTFTTTDATSTDDWEIQAALETVNDFTITSGNVDSNSNNGTIGRDFTITNVTNTDFDAGTAILTVARHFVDTGNLFTESSSELKMTGTGDLNSAGNLYKFTVTGTVTKTSSNTLLVVNTLDIQLGGNLSTGTSCGSIQHTGGSGTNLTIAGTLSGSCAFWQLSSSEPTISISGTVSFSATTVEFVWQYSGIATYTIPAYTTNGYTTFYPVTNDVTYRIGSGTMSAGGFLFKHNTAGKTLTIDNTVNNSAMTTTVRDFEFTSIAGSTSFLMGSATYTVKRHWNNADTAAITAGTSTVNFDGGGTITSAGQSFYNVITTSGTTTVGDALSVTNDLTMTGGTLAGTQNVTINGHVAGTSGTINLTGGTFEQRVSTDKNFGTTSGSTAWTFNNLTFSDSGAASRTITTQTGGSGGITVSGILTLGQVADSWVTNFDAGNRTWTLSGTGGDPYQVTINGLLLSSTSTFAFTGNNGGGNTNIEDTGAYYNLTINNGSETYTLEGAATINNNLTISAGTLDVTGSNFAITLKGNYSNSGTFSANSGTVTLSGTSTQTLSGTMTTTSAFYNLTITNSSGASPSDNERTGFTASVDFDAAATITNNYVITTANVRVEYQSAATYTVANINWNGQASGTRIYFRNSVAGSGTWLLNVSGVQTAVSYVNVSRSDASPGSTIVASDGTNFNALNNTNWTFSSTLTGTVYGTDETTAVVSGPTVRLYVNGTTTDTAVANGSGVYTFTTGYSANDVLSIYLDTGGGITGLTVTKATAAAMTNIHIYQDRITTRCDNSCSLTNANINSWDKDNDTDIHATATTSGPTTTLTVDNDWKLKVTNATFAPGGTVTTSPTGGSSYQGQVGIDSGATLDMVGNALSIGGNYSNAGTFTSGSNTTTFTDTAASNTMTGTMTGSSAFYNLIFDGTGGGWNLGAAIEATNDFTVTAGTFNTSNGASSFNVTVTRDLSIANSASAGITANSSTITVSRNWSKGSSGVFTRGTSTVQLNGDGEIQTVGGGQTQFNNLTAAYNGKTTTMATSRTDVFGTLTLGDASGGTMTCSVTCEFELFRTSGTDLVIGSAATLSGSNATFQLRKLSASTVTVTGATNYGTWSILMNADVAGLVTFNIGGNITTTGYMQVKASATGTSTFNTQNYTLIADKWVQGDSTASGATASNWGSSTATFNRASATDTFYVNSNGGSHTANFGTASISVTGHTKFVNGTGTLAVTPGTSTFTFAPSTGTSTYSPNSQSLYNVIVNGAATVQPDAAVAITNDLTMTAGTLNGTQDITVNGNVAGTAGIISLTGGTFEQRVGSDKNFGTTSGSTAWTFNDLTFSNSCSLICNPQNNITTQTGGTGGVTVSGVLRTGKSGDTNITVLGAGNRTWTLSGTTGDSFQLLASPAGALTASTSTFTYTGANAGGNSTVQVATYCNLSVGGTTGDTYVLEGATTTSNAASCGDLTIVAPSSGASTLDTVSGSNWGLTIGGNYANNSVFTARSGTVTFSATDTGNTLSGTLSGSSAFYDLVFSGSGGEWTPSAAVAVTNDLTMTAGSLLGTQNVTVNGNVAGTAGIISLTGGTFTQRASANKNFGTTSGSTAWTFSSLTFSNSCVICSGNGITFSTQAGTGGITVSGVLKVGDTGDGDNSYLNAGAGGRTWTLSGTGGDPFQILTGAEAGDLVPNVSTFNYTGNNAGGNTTVQAATYYNLTVNNGSETYVLEAATTTSNDLTITAGTLDTVSGSNWSLTIGGNYSNSGTFTANSGTVTFNATDTGNTLSGTLSGSSAFYNLVFNDGVVAPPAEWTPSAAVAVTNDLTMTSGSLLGTQNLTVSGGDITGNGTINLTGGTTTLTGSGNFGGNTAWIFYNLTFGSTATGTDTATATGSGGITTSNVLTVTAKSGLGCVMNTLNAGSKTWTLSGTTGAPLVVSGTLTPSTSTITFTGNNGSGNTNVPGSGAACGDATYNNLTLNNNTEIYAVGGTTNITVNGNLTITAGTFTAGSGTTTVKGNFSNSGTFTANSGTVTLSGTSTQTLSGTLTSGSAFYNLTLSNASGTDASDCERTSFVAGIDFDTAATVTNNYTITTASVRVEYNSGSTYTINNMNWNGQAVGTRLYFRNSAASGTWLLNVTAVGNAQTKVSYVNVSRSDASGGATIIASDGTNLDCGANVNWQFDETLTLGLDSTSKDFGVISPGSNPSNQVTTLTATSNAVNGYVIYAWSTQAMTNVRFGGVTISDWTGTNATPTLFSAGSYGFGYSTNDLSLTGGTSDRFDPGGGGIPRYAGFTHTGPGDPVADRTAPATGTTNTINYRLYPSTTQADGDYSTVIVYVIAAQFP